jgi:hypothetical protein
MMLQNQLKSKEDGRENNDFITNIKYLKRLFK